MEAWDEAMIPQGQAASSTASPLSLCKRGWYKAWMSRWLAIALIVACFIFVGCRTSDRVHLDASVPVDAGDAGSSTDAGDAGISGCVPAFSGPAGSALTHDEFRDALERSLCESVFACPVYWDDIASIKGLTTTVDECVPLMTQSLANDRRAIADAIATGVVVFDGGAAASCLGALSYCSLYLLGAWDDVISNVPGCQGVYTGTVSAPGACEIEEACLPGNHCVAPASGCQGTCAPDVALGDPCLRTTDCPVGAVCDTSEGVCKELTYTFACNASSPCGRGGSTNTTVAFTNCPPGTACNGTVCVRPFAANAPCDNAYDAPCVLGYECLPDADGGTSCLTASTASAPGAACGANGPGPQYCKASASLFCDFDAQTCRMFGAAADDPCDPWFDLGSTCAAGLYCDSGTSTCQPERGSGLGCTDDVQCSSKTCDGATCAAAYCPL